MRRVLAFGLIGLTLGLILGGGLQLGLTALRFLLQPDWLTQDMASVLTPLVGALTAAAVAGGIAMGLRRALGGVAIGGLFVALWIAALLDPYYLAEFGWVAPARNQDFLRALSFLIAIAGLQGVLRRAGIPSRRFMLPALAGLALYTALPRFTGVILLGGDLDMAVNSPLHLMVFAKACLLLIAATALAMTARTATSKA